MKKVFITLMLTIAVAVKGFGIEPPDGTFSWGVQVPLQMDYLSSETLSVTSGTVAQFNVTYELEDPAMAQYIAINGNVVTVLRHYAGDSELTQGRIYIKAVISGMSDYDDTELTTYIRTRKIVPAMQWNCTLGDMQCGSSVRLSATHGNTDRPDMEVTYSAADYVSNPSLNVSIDQASDMMTATNVGSGIYVIAKIDSTDNYKAASMAYLREDSIVRFNITKGHRGIRWDGTDFKSLTNLSKGIELHTQYLEESDTVWYSTSDQTIAEIVGGNYLKINGPGRVTVSALLKENDNYYESRSDTIIDIPVVGTIIYWDENAIKGVKQVITSTIENYNLNVFTKSNYTDGTRYHFSSSDTSVAKIFGDTLLTCYKMGSFELSAYATNSIGGRSTDISRNVDVNRGFMRFIKNGNWSDRNNWERSDLEPDKEDYSVEMLAKCTIPDGTTAGCHDLKIYTQGGLIVEPGGTLHVENCLENNAGEGQLILKADGRKQGAVFFRKGNPLAEVEIWMNVSAVDGNDTVWEYKGIPLDTTHLRNKNGKQKVYEYSESRSENNGWRNISSMMPQLKAWTAYRITDTLPACYSFVGRLNAGENHRFELGHSDHNGQNAGMNMIVNSFSAPIDIRAIEFDGVEEELHYPTGLQWGTAPKYTASAIGSRSTMQPGDALFVKTGINGASVTMDYEQAMNGDLTCDEDFNVLKLAISGYKYSDTVALVTYENGSEAFENGYDGTKWLGPDSLPQIYVTTDWGRAAVNTDRSFVGQNIGVIAANDAEQYNITFDTKNLKGYDQLYLFDMRTQAYVDIIAGESYSFTTTRLGEDKRFTIMRDKITGKKDKDGHGFVVLGNRVLLVGFGTEHSLVRVMNLAGVVVYEFWSDEGPWIELPPLFNGIYIINSGQSYTKFYR